MQESSRYPVPKTWKWNHIVAEFTKADHKKSNWQIINSFVPFFVLWILAYFSLGISYWLTLGIAVIAGGMVARIFIIQHDCGHGSFYNSRKANNIVGQVCSIITLTPYYAWRKSHALHHAHTGDLDNRGDGDVYTMTIKEYQAAPWYIKTGYRIYRHPLFLFGIVPLFLFVVSYRFPFLVPKERKLERKSVHYTNLAILIVLILMHFTIGLKSFFLVQGPITFVTTTLGVWLFYVQHQFERTYWDEHDEWAYVLAAVQGSSFYKLPKVLQWFTGNIGFHHIHHLSPRIPNYLLEKCHNSHEAFQRIQPLTLWKSLKSISLRVWDEQQERLVSFREMQRLVKERSQIGFA